MNWQDYIGRVVVGDCLDLLPGLPIASVDVVVTDPPYGLNTRSDGSGKLSPWADLCNSSGWYAAWLAECRRVLKPRGSLWTCLNWRSLVTFQKASCDIRWPIESLMVWDKNWIGPGGPRGLRPSYELVALFAMPDFFLSDRGLPDIQRFPWSAYKPNGHPAEKPERLVEFCIRHGARGEGGLVLDPFAGSGTVSAVAERLGYRHIGYELDPHWAAMAEKRIARERDKLQLPMEVNT